MISETSIVGCLLGTAIGDALGLPYEGLSPRRAARMLGEPDRYRFVFGRGMISDDAEHACLVAQALIESGGDPDRFVASLGRRLRNWFLCMPAGIGLATLRACGKLCLGISPHRSGVFSAGNGPAMRAAILGAAVDDLELLRKLVRGSSRVTHRDPRAEFGAWAVAFAARHASERGTVEPAPFAKSVRETLAGERETAEAADLVDLAAESVLRGETTREFAIALGCERGVSGFVYRTVPVALHAAMRSPRDLRHAVQEAIRCGGDTDSVAAIVGGIVGSAVGREGIPVDLLTNLRDAPRSTNWIETLGKALFRGRISQAPARPPALSIFLTIPRNVAFAAIVLAHGFRRLGPPY